MVLEVDTSSLRSAASDMTTAAAEMATTADGVANLGSVFDANVQAGFDALTTAWGAAIDVLAEDVGLLAGRTNDAADVYDTTDDDLASGFGRAIPE
jgi:hypothetical protein